MYIKEIELHNFGCFQDWKISLGPGLNVLYGPNESGKTTLHAFLTGMFFGIRRMRGRAAKSDRYSRYEPWENPPRYGGAIRFFSGGKDFWLERSFSKERARASLICETDGEQLSVADGDLQMLLGDISESTYANTASIGQFQAAPGKELAAQLENYMANYQESGTGDLDIQGALETLRKKQRELKKVREKEEALWQDGLRRYQEKIAFLEQELEELQKRREMVKDIREEEKTEGKETFPSVRLIWGGIVLLGILLGAILFFAPGLWKLLTLAGILGEGGLFWYQRRVQALLECQQVEMQEQRREWDRQKWAAARLKEEWEEKSLQLFNLQSECREYEDSQRASAEILEELEGVALAIETIEELSGRMRSRFGRQLREQTSSVFAALTNGKYTQVDMHDSMEMGVIYRGRYVPLEQLSRGTVEQIYFSLRMAAADILCQEEELPILLDDVFVMYDEERLSQALRWLANDERQVLLGTCQKREIEMLHKMRLPFWEILLPQSL